MENSNIHDSKDGERPPIRVVNGEAKPSNGKKAKVLLSLAVVVLLAGLGGTGYLYSQEKTDNEALSSQIVEADSEVGSLQERLDEVNAEALKKADESKTALPKNYKEYTDADNKFSLYYPSAWKDFKPKVTAIDDYEAERIYSPTVKYNQEEDAWIVTKSNGAEAYPKDSYYQAPVIRKDRKLTVYDFSFGEGGCARSKLVFMAGKNAVELESPQACHDGEGDGNGPFEVLDAQTEEVAFSITII
ncbi:MAG TPA: hypothetical protein VFX79_03220 [Candidatus Saccharimonadales bacterium]|nr:hypothetical protein [Candidatus Saccharimonadales bacterium]